MTSSSTALKRRPRRPVSRSSSSSDAPPAAAAAASMAARGHAARPRLVCRITPVALTTRSRPAEPAPIAVPIAAPSRSRSRRSRVWASSLADDGFEPPASADRSSAMTSRATSRTAPRSRRSRPKSAARSTACTLGGRTSGIVRVSGGSAWESNPPRGAERRATGFEDRGTHRGPSAPAPSSHTLSPGRAAHAGTSPVRRAPSGCASHDRPNTTRSAAPSWAREALPVPARSPTSAR